MFIPNCSENFNRSHCIRFFFTTFYYQVHSSVNALVYLSDSEFFQILRNLAPKNRSIKYVDFYKLSA